MAQGKDSQDKTENATPKRLRDARKKGQVAKSRDLTTVVVMIVVFIAIAFSAPMMGQEFEALMRHTFTIFENGSPSANDMMTAGKMALVVMAKVLAPPFVAGFASALLIGFLQVGPVFSGEPLTPKMEKLNPVEGFKNMFKVVTFVELIKNILKVSLVLYLAYLTISQFLQEILLSSQVDIVTSISMTGEIIYSFFVKVAIVFLVIALIDMYVQRWNYLKNMRMSKDEVRREYKQEEGDPQIKGERRRLHREMVFGGIRQNVKKADAVVSNPIHVAVAIKYDRETMAAPEVLLKGQRKFAESMLQIAREEHIPIVRNIPLAWSLLQIEEGEAIPEDLYEAIAEVLCYVYEKKQAEEKKQITQEKTTPPSLKDFDPLG